MRARLFAARLHYVPGLELHTAASGAVAALDERYLLIEDDQGGWGLGGIRANIEYLSGVPVARLDGLLRDSFDWWQAQPSAEQALVSLAGTGWPALLRTLAEQALLDLIARRAGVALAELIAERAGLEAPVLSERMCLDSNQTLFWQSEASLFERAVAYADAGFHELKLRVGIEDVATDLRRLERLRALLGDRVRLAVDVNGQWSLSEAQACLPALAELGVAYVEQPLPACAWEQMATLAAGTELTLLLDEALVDSHSLARLDTLPANVGGHLKLVKLGGPQALVEAALTLRDQGRALMIGQMNEGALATAACAHCALALNETAGELYGAFGLIDEPFALLDYHQGRLRLPIGHGLGVEREAFDQAGRCNPSFEEIKR
ncbi:mandelate racemase/muconate lactonizing enzyme family protein [Halotalea alkalilenta]|uniref:mandelate racemase/muconate lactonizing enzyme family protein n=1 Tax=Halotalea alkalilenta TaxID=376489 RepID=UPI0006937A94|nr:enolase C-terminal domain-like protein [Halotalea alkalilenta]